MAMTLGTAATNLRDRLDEPSAGFWSDAQIRRYINEGCREISRRGEPLRTSTTASVTAGTRDYTGPTDAARIHECFYNMTGSSTLYPLEYRDLAALNNIWGTNQSIDRSTPIYWTTWGSAPTLTIRLWPVPAVNGTLTVYYYKLATELATNGSADSSNLDLPAGWEDLALDWAEYRALIQAKQPALAGLARQTFEQHLADLLAGTSRYTDQPGSIIYEPAGYDSIWGWY